MHSVKLLLVWIGVGLKMACEKFKNYKPQKEQQVLLEQIMIIINDYMIKGFVLTCRQIYYQLVARVILTNNQKNYNKVTKIISNARMAGIIDWNAIVDRNRESYMHYYNLGIDDAINDTLEQYRVNRMLLQDVYIEVMIEKMAIYDIIKTVTNKYSIRLTGDKGFCSNTILYDISKRMIRALQEGKTAYILYVGDHDPSGLTMDKTIKETISLMGANGVEFRRVALTSEQVKEYNLPPNVVKDGDRNSGKYKEEHGSTSWECDALPPEILVELLETEILQIIDIKRYNYMCTAEEEDKEKLRQLIDSIKMTNN